MVNEVAAIYADSCSKECVAMQETGFKVRNGRDFGEFVKSKRDSVRFPHCTPEISFGRIGMSYINHEKLL